MLTKYRCLYYSNDNKCLAKIIKRWDAKMFITRECDYAIRIVRELADGEIKTVREISAAEHIPQQYAYKILKKLENAQMINTFRGAYGGYRLRRCLTKITIYDLLMATTGNVVINECLKENINCLRNTEQSPCVVHQEFQRVEGLIIIILQEKTLAELLGSKMLPD